MSGSLLATETAPVTIAFSEIPYDIQVPGTYVEIAANYSQAGLVAYPAKALILCPIASTGTAVALTPVQVFTPQQADVYFGTGSVGAAMCRAFLRANGWTPLWAMGITDAGGATASTWTIPIVFSATLTGAPGTLTLYIGGRPISITVTPGVDTATTVATALQAAIVATPNLPVTVARTTFTLTLTARDKGSMPGQLPVAFNIMPGDTMPGGVTAGASNLTAVITPSVGTGVNSVANAMAAIPGTWFTHIVCPWTDGTSQAALATELDRRFNSMVKLDARAFGFTSQTSLTNLLAVTSGLNSRFVSILGLQNCPTPPWEMAALYAAVSIFNLTNDPARQLRGLLLPGAVPPANADILNLESEFQSMITGGMATATVEPDGTVRIQRAVTTYQTAAGGVADSAWRDIMTAETASRIRYDWESYVGLVYPRAKMAADGSLAAEYDDTIVTPRRMHSSWGARCRLYEQQGWIQNSQATVKASVFQLDASNPNRMNARQQYQQMNNLMVLAGQMQFSLLAQQSSTQQTQ